jgi:hypothetical protein
VGWSKDDVGLVLCEVLGTRSQEVTPIPSFPCISRGNLFNLSDCSVNASLAGGLWTHNIRGYLWGSNLQFLGLQINAGLLRVKLFQSNESWPQVSVSKFQLSIQHLHIEIKCQISNNC